MKHVAAFGNFKWEILVNNDRQNPIFYERLSGDR